MSARHVALDFQKNHTKRKQQNKYKTKQKQNIYVYNLKEVLWSLWQTQQYNDV
jgi:hypothetical protein